MSIRHMTGVALRLLCVGAPAPAADSARFEVIDATGFGEAMLCLKRSGPFDAVIVDGDSAAVGAFELAELLENAALIVVVRDPDAEHAGMWLRRGADDVIGRDELAAPSTARRVRFAVERRRRDAARLNAYSTDPGTGLPHRQQLVEHLSQMLALREREPSPMAVLVLRVEGLQAQADVDGHDLDAMRRKLAVRLRAAVRASDVVASLDNVAFAVLLGSILAPDDAERVADKLIAALIAPVAVAGVERAVAVAVGIGRYPQDGKDAERLLRRAAALAAAAPASGKAGPAAAHDAQGAARVAANDDA